MQGTTRHIITVGILLGCLSMLYFTALVVNLPFILIIVFAMAATILLGRQFSLPDAVNTIKYPAIGWVILTVGIVVITARSYSLALEYGGWDAWCMWNLHARYLAGGEDTWRNLFLNVYADHTDYPLLVPGVSGFFMKLIPAGFAVIPFVLSFGVTLCIPVLIWLEAAKKNLFVATLFLIPFAADHFYLFSGFSQYADVVLAFFLLCAIICIDHIAEHGRNAALAALCLGCCIWTKNEGIILALMVILFHVRTLLSAENRKYFIGVLILPLLVYGIFKLFYAPQNDLVGGLNRQTLQQLLQPARYKLILHFFKEQLCSNFIYTDIACILYVTVGIILRRFPGRNFIMLLCCMLVYLSIYLLSSQNLEWHLSTSLERLMLQLMPAMMYVISQRLADVQYITGEAANALDR